jgi:hypothetical protein
MRWPPALHFRSPHQRTMSGSLDMSQTCQTRTCRSLDHIVGASKQCGRRSEAECSIQLLMLHDEG